MRRGQGERLPIPTLNELKSAIEAKNEFVACSALKHGPIAVMTLSLDNTGTATVCFDEDGALYLSAALKVLFPNIGSAPASPVKVTQTVDGIGIQSGYQSN